MSYSLSLSFSLSVSSSLSLSLPFSPSLPVPCLSKCGRNGLSLSLSLSLSPSQLPLCPPVHFRSRSRLSRSLCLSPLFPPCLSKYSPVCLCISLPHSLSFCTCQNAVDTISLSLSMSLCSSAPFRILSRSGSAPPYLVGSVSLSLSLSLFLSRSVALSLFLHLTLPLPLFLPLSRALSLSLSSFLYASLSPFFRTFQNPIETGKRTAKRSAPGPKRLLYRVSKHILLSNVYIKHIRLSNI